MQMNISTETTNKGLLVRLTLGCVLLVLAAYTLAAPAPWYVWESKTADHVICRQNYPGQGWLKIAGPFTNAKCGKYLKQLKIGSTIWSVEPNSMPRKNK